MSVGVVTDSAASIPADLAAPWGIEVVEQHAEKLEGTTTTAAPSPGEFLRAVARTGCDEVVVLTVSSQVSGTWNAARLAAGDSPVPMDVIDTETAAGAQALVVLAAARAAAGGADVAGVRAAAFDAIGRVRLVAVIEGLDHLVRSGRVPGLAAWAGRVLGLKPMFEFRHGAAQRLRPAASREAALSRIIGHWRRSRDSAGPGHLLHVVALHADAEPEAEGLLKRVRDELDGTAATELVLEFSEVMVAHTGPGLVGLAWWWEPPGLGGAQPSTDPGPARQRRS
jgi:DegV family protein with EDD domain